MSHAEGRKGPVPGDVGDETFALELPLERLGRSVSSSSIVRVRGNGLWVPALRTRFKVGVGVR